MGVDKGRFEIQFPKRRLGSQATAWASKAGPQGGCCALETPTPSLLGAIGDGQRFPAAAMPVASEPESPSPALLMTVGDKS